MDEVSLKILSNICSLKYNAHFWSLFDSLMCKENGSKVALWVETDTDPVALWVETNTDLEVI